MRIKNWTKILLKFGSEEMVCDIIGVFDNFNYTENLYLVCSRRWLICDAMVLTKKELDETLVEVLGRTNVIVRILRTITRF